MRCCRQAGSPRLPARCCEEFMKPLGLTQAQLAETLGMPRVTVNAIINGKSSITPGIVRATLTAQRTCVRHGPTGSRPAMPATAKLAAGPPGH
jgi:hypothetical protein